MWIFEASIRELLPSGQMKHHPAIRAGVLRRRMSHCQNVTCIQTSDDNDEDGVGDGDGGGGEESNSGGVTMLQ